MFYDSTMQDYLLTILKIYIKIKDVNYDFQFYTRMSELWFTIFLVISKLYLKGCVKRYSGFNKIFLQPIT